MAKAISTMPAQALQHFKMTHVSERRTCIRYFACIDILWYVFYSWVWICTSILHNPEKNKVFVFWECEMIFKSEDKSEDKNTYVNSISKLSKSLFEGFWRQIKTRSAALQTSLRAPWGSTGRLTQSPDAGKRNWRLARDMNISRKVGYAIVPSKIATRRWLKLYMLSRLSILWKLPPFTFLLHSEEIDGIQWTRIDKQRRCEISLHYYVTWTSTRLDWWLCKCSSGWHCCTFSTGTWTTWT